MVETLSGPATLTLAANENAAGWTYDLDMTAPGADLTAAGSVTGLGETPRVAADLTARIADLAPYSDLAGRPLEGSVSLEAKGETGLRPEGSRRHARRHR